MNFAFNDEQREIQATAKRLMEETAKLDRVVGLAETDRGWDPDDYAHIAGLGWTGLHIPEEFGGVGYGYVELIVVMEQLGMALYPSPFFASVCLAANALLESGDPGAHAELLGAIASGQKTATLAYTEPGGLWRPPDVRLEARADGGDYVLTGEKEFVVDGHTADVLIVAARTGERDGDVTLFCVDGDAPGVSRAKAHAVDETRKLATVKLDGARVPAAAIVGEANAGWSTLKPTMELASTALAAEMLGGAQHCFDVALAYTKDRFQFGRPIAAFQAIKHTCADLLMGVEQTRSAAYYAGWAAANDREELRYVAHLAKAQAGDTYWNTAKANIQIHGGIGFTYEHEAHYYYRRATASRQLLGDSDFHREMMLMGLGADPLGSPSAASTP